MSRRVGSWGDSSAAGRTGRGEHWGVCSTPTVEGDRLYLVTPYGEAVCVNVASWLASHATASAEESDRHIVWKYDMVEKLHVEQDHTASCSPLVLGDFVYVCTGNGRYKTAKRPLYPLTPSLIAFNKHTGQLVARDDEQIGEQLWRGQWSSPSAAMVNGKAQILFATGNGLCYGFEPADPAAQVAPDRWITETLRGPIVYYIDVEGKDTAGLTPAQYAEAHHVLSPKDKPALPLEFRYSIRMPADHADRFDSEGPGAGRPDLEEDLVVRLPAAGIPQCAVLRTR